jgi:putative aldouronate transport system substrate-binding protein
MAERTAQSRRSFLRLAAGGVALSALLEACAAPAPPAGGAATPAAAGGARVQLPSFVPFLGAAPDFVGSPDGILPPAFLNYPRNPPRTVTQPVGKGDDVNAMMYTTQAPPTPVEQNAAWQEVNRQLGVNMKFPLIQLADYNTKLNTTIAGGQLPDLLSLGAGNGSAVANLPDFLNSQCLDLTPFLSGDAVKDFPNLANLPTYAWRNAVFNNKLYAVPTVRASITGSIMFGKGKLLEPVGGITYKNADDFMRVMKQLTGGGSQWGLGVTSGSTNGIPGVLTYFLESFGAPNQWRVDNTSGKLTKDWETEEFKSAVAFARSLWDAGVMHPDSPSMQINQAAQNFYAGKTALWSNGFTIGDVAWNRAYAMDADFGFHAVAPFSHDGTSKPVHHLGPGTALLTVLKKSSDTARVKELLGVLNFFAAPFGTAEFLLIWYGIEGKEFTFDANGNPIATVTSGGQAITNPDLFIPWPNIGSPASVLYDANSADYGRVMHQDASVIQNLGIQNPVVGLYSATNSKLAATLNQKMGDGLSDIIFGRADVGSLDQLVKDWRAQGGDVIRSEFEAALAGR